MPMLYTIAGVPNPNLYAPLFVKIVEKLSGVRLSSSPLSCASSLTWFLF